MKMTIIKMELEGTPKEITKTVRGLVRDGIIPASADSDHEFVSVSEEFETEETGDLDSVSDQDVQKSETKRNKKQEKDYYKEGSVYKEVIDLYNAICTKLARRKETCNWHLKKRIDKLFTLNPMQMEDIRRAFYQYQSGEWFDDPSKRTAYGNFCWCIQRSKLDNALMGKYMYRIKNNNNYESKNNKTIDRQQLGGEDIHSTGLDF